MDTKTSLPREVGDSAPKTIGDLRRRLADIGSPWRPDPALSDDELIPIYPTGGDGSRDPVGELLAPGTVIEHLRDQPPHNPFLRELWKKRDLLARMDNKPTGSDNKG